MNRKDLVEELSQRFEGNREVAEQALDSVVDVITRSISTGEKVIISGFGEFERRAREAGEKAEEYVPEFKPGKELRDVVSGAREWRDRVTDSLAVVPAAAVEQASRAAASTMRSVAEKARELAAELSAVGEPDGAEAPAAGQATKKSAAKKSTAKKSTAKKSTAKKTAAKKSTASKSTAKKASAKKASGKKSAAKKAPAAKKTAAKTSPAKTSPAKKSTAKKAPAAKKATEAPAKKTTAS